MFDYQTSKRIADKQGSVIRSHSSKAIDALYELGDKAFYVEGWAVTSGDECSAIEHCWVEIDGRIIDPTLCDNPPVFYYPGVYYSKDELNNALQETNFKSPVVWYINGLDPINPAYGTAGKKAIKKMYELSEQKQTGEDKAD